MKLTKDLKKIKSKRNRIKNRKEDRNVPLVTNGIKKDAKCKRKKKKKYVDNVTNVPVAGTLNCSRPCIIIRVEFCQKHTREL